MVKKWELKRRCEALQEKNNKLFLELREMRDLIGDIIAATGVREKLEELSSARLVERFKATNETMIKVGNSTYLRPRELDDISYDPGEIPL